MIKDTDSEPIKNTWSWHQARETLANHRGHKTVNQPKINAADAKRGKTWTSKMRLVLVLLLIGWKSGESVFRPIAKRSDAKPITLEHSNENHSIIFRKCDTKGDTRWLWHDVLARLWRPKMIYFCDSFFLDRQRCITNQESSLTLQLLSSFYTALPPGYEVHLVHTPDFYCK